MGNNLTAILAVGGPIVGGLIMWGIDALHLVHTYSWPLLIGISLWAIFKIWEV